MRALVRGLSPRFLDALVGTPAETPIDLALARHQHAAYVDALRGLGVALTLLEAHPDHPDCCFVEDCAVVLDGTALITRPGAPSRRGETTAVREALADRLRIETMEAPATLDGGDCLRLGRRIFVGQSERTNAAGIARLREVAVPLGFEVTEVPLRNALHLKCVCSGLGPDLMLLADDSVPPACFEGVEIITVPAAETPASNCVVVGKTVLLPAGFPRTEQAVSARGFMPVLLESSEIRKADGLLTCLSVLY